MAKVIIAKVEIRGIEDWDSFHDSKSIEELELELRQIEKDIKVKIHTLTGGSISDVNVKCNLIF
jgi:hypothetical protein